MLAMVWEGRRVLVRDADPPETTWLGDLIEQCCGVPLPPGPGRMSQP